jgi:curved DNA-binding protein CbpA
MKSRTTSSMTICTKTGIKIKKGKNEYIRDPFENANPFDNYVKENERIDINYNNLKKETIDLNIENYSREELYKLFGFKTSVILTDEIMKEIKKIVLKTHPDKSRLDNKYFIFFNKAFKKIQEIYEFQNKFLKKTTDNNEYYDSQNIHVLDNLFINKKELKDPQNFNNWFNDQFEKHRTEDPVEHGYGSWLKSDEDIIFTPSNINKDTMASEINKLKKNIQSISPYKGIEQTHDVCSVGGQSLMEYNSNFSSGLLFSGGGVGFTDLKQAYVESVIPISDDDYNNIPKFNSVDEYKRHRNNVIVDPLSKNESMRQLFNKEKLENEESSALAFYHAQQLEKSNKNNKTFWSSLKHITN